MNTKRIYDKIKKVRINIFYEDKNKTDRVIVLKKLISILILVAFTANIPVFAENTKVSDWAKNDVEEAIRIGIVPQDMQDDYQKSITRAEFTKISMMFLSYKFGMPVEEFVDWYLSVHVDSTGKNPEFLDDTFQDIKGSKYEYYIKCANSIRIVYGKGDGIFDPDGLITREEAATMLLRVYFCYGSGVKLGPASENVDYFSDIKSISSWADTAVRYMYQWGVMKGVSDTHYGPKMNYTKEQCYTTFIRLNSVYSIL